MISFLISIGKLQKMFYMCSIFLYYTSQIFHRTGGVLYIVFSRIEHPYHHWNCQSLYVQCSCDCRVLRRIWNDEVLSISIDLSAHRRCKDLRSNQSEWCMRRGSSHLCLRFATLWTPDATIQERPCQILALTPTPSKNFFFKFMLSPDVLLTNGT